MTTACAPTGIARGWSASSCSLPALARHCPALRVTGRLDGYALPNARIALDTAVAVVASIVAILTAIRFLVEGRGMDLLLAAGFLATGVGTFVFAVAPVLPGGRLDTGRGWAGDRRAGSSAGRSSRLRAVREQATREARRRALVATAALVARALSGIWVDVEFVGIDLGSSGIERAARHAARRSSRTRLLAVLALVAVVGFGLRYRRHGRDLDSWLTLALTLVVFADLHYVLAPLRSSVYVLPSDFLRLLAYGVLLVGVWRAISQAEFGRAVAEERARVAREIHDGLAQYLFALSTHVTHARVRRPAGRDAAAAEARGDGSAAGGALRDPRTLLGVGIGSVRRGARAATSTS